METCAPRDSLAQAHLHCSLGIVELERAHMVESRKHQLECQRLRLALLPEQHEEIANDLNNWANILLQESRSPESAREAERLFRKAIEMDKYVDRLKPESQKDELLHIKYFGLGEALESQGRYDEAIEAFETGRAHAIRVLGSGEHWDAG